MSRHSVKNELIFFVFWCPNVFVSHVKYLVVTPSIVVTEQCRRYHTMYSGFLIFFPLHLPSSHLLLLFTHSVASLIVLSLLSLLPWSPSRQQRSKRWTFSSMYISRRMDKKKNEWAIENSVHHPISRRSSRATKWEQEWAAYSHRRLQWLQSWSNNESITVSISAQSVSTADGFSS